MKKIDVQIDNLYVLEALFNLAKNVETTKIFTLLMLECVQCYLQSLKLWSTYILLDVNHLNEILC